MCITYQGLIYEISRMRSASSPNQPHISAWAGIRRGGTCSIEGYRGVGVDVKVVNLTGFGLLSIRDSGSDGS